MSREGVENWRGKGEENRIAGKARRNKEGKERRTQEKRRRENCGVGKEKNRREKKKTRWAYLRGEECRKWEGSAY